MVVHLTENELTILKKIMEDCAPGYIKKVSDDFKEVKDVCTCIDKLENAEPEVIEWKPKRFISNNYHEQRAAVPIKGCKGENCVYWDLTNGCTASLTELCNNANVLINHLKLDVNQPETLPLDSSIIKLYKSGKSPKQIADHLNKDESLIWDRLRKMGLK